MRDLPLRLVIKRGGTIEFDGKSAPRDSSVRSKMPRNGCSPRWTSPKVAFLMTGTGLVPPNEFTLKPGDAVRIVFGDPVLENKVA